MPSGAQSHLQELDHSLDVALDQNGKDEQSQRSCSKQATNCKPQFARVACSAGPCTGAEFFCAIDKDLDRGC